MSVRSPIQVPEELKAKVDGLRDQFRMKTQYEVIEKLIAKHEEFDRFRRSQEDKWAEERQRQEREQLQVGTDAKQNFTEIKAELGLRSDAAAIEFLIDHYRTSPTISRDTFRMYQKLR